jgi:hypothetical protein
MTVGEYVGMQITLMGSTLTMIIDTAASANIITQATASRLQVCACACACVFCVCVRVCVCVGYSDWWCVWKRGSAYYYLSSCRARMVTWKFCMTGAQDGSNHLSIWCHRAN